MMREKKKSDDGLAVVSLPTLCSHAQSYKPSICLLARPSHPPFILFPASLVHDSHLLAGLLLVSTRIVLLSRLLLHAGRLLRSSTTCLGL